MQKTNYFDEHGNYINVENLSLSEIYKRAAQEGYKKGYTDASLGIKSDDISKTADVLFDKLMNGGV